MENIFTDIYEKNEWGTNHSSEYSGSSGGGSDIGVNIHTYVPFLKRFIENTNIKTVADLGCGDFRCGEAIYGNLDVMYVGYDAYDRVIQHHSNHYFPPKYTFRHLDFCNYKEDIAPADLCILKDVLQHWSLSNIYAFLDYIVETKKFKYILICNCCRQTEDDTDILDGKWRPLSADFFPLKKYGAAKMYTYATKEVSLVEIH
jgi:hypothetical protein